MSAGSQTIIDNIFNRALARTKSLSTILNYFYKKPCRAESQLSVKKLTENLQILFSKTIDDIKNLPPNNSLIVETTKLIGFLSTQGLRNEKLVRYHDEHEHLYDFLVQLKNLAINQINADEIATNERFTYDHIKDVSSCTTNEQNLQTVLSSMENLEKLRNEIISNGTDEQHQLRVVSRTKLKEISSSVDKRIEEIISEYSDLNKSAYDEKLFKHQEYQANLNRTMCEEKVLRNGIFERKTVIRDLIGQYDTDMGEKWSSMMKVQEQFRRDQDQFNHWMTTFNEQEIVFNEVLVQIKLKEFQQQVQHFIRNRWAKIIQRQFREFSVNRRAKRRKGKPKPKGRR